MGGAMNQVDYIRSLLETLDSNDESARHTASGELDAIIYPKSVSSDGRCVGPSWDEACRRREEHDSQLRESGLLVPLMQALSADGEGAKVYSAGALSAANERRATPLLVQALKDESPKVRAAAARGLWFISDPMTVDALAASLNDENIEVRSAAAFTLGMLKDARAVAPLLNLLASKVDEDRASALFALGEIGDEAVLPTVRDHLHDKSKQVKKAAKGVLSRFDWKRREGKAS